MVLHIECSFDSEITIKSKMNFQNTNTNTLDFSVCLCPKFSVFAFLVGTQIHRFRKNVQSRHTGMGSRYTEIAKNGKSCVSMAPICVSTQELVRTFSNKLRWLRLVRFQSATSPIPLTRTPHSSHSSQNLQQADRNKTSYITINHTPLNNQPFTPICPFMLPTRLKLCVIAPWVKACQHVE